MPNKAVQMFGIATVWLLLCGCGSQINNHNQDRNTRYKTHTTPWQETGCEYKYARQYDKKGRFNGTIWYTECE